MRFTVSTILRVIGFLLTAASAALAAHDWRYFRPSLKSDVQDLTIPAAATLLRQFCTSAPTLVARIGMTCTTRPAGGAFSDIIDNQFHPETVIYGHFLRSDSEDAVVGGRSAETHPARWGGTLSLTKRNAQWVPLWYKSALIVHSCVTMPTPSGREILLCEDEDGGMGRQLHYLYAIDLKEPADLRHSLLTSAESYNDGCTTQNQTLGPVRWISGKTRFSVTVRTIQWDRFTEGACAGNSGMRPATAVHFEFAATANGIQQSR